VALDAFVTQAGERRLAGLETALRRIKAHEMAATLAARVERVEMATRLCRWLVTAPPALPAFQGRATDYVTAGAYADWARTRLVGGDQSAEFSRALNGLSVQVAARREQINRSFAESLKAWNETGSSSSLLGVEEILGRVVAPLVQHAPVLLLVVDGLSAPVFAELEQDILRLGWVSMQPAGAPWPGAAVAALPTVTEVSRASLLSGRLTTGGQAQERAAFSAYEGFAPHARTGAPLLFHKGDLLGGDGLAAEVREAVGNRERKLIGVVYNAIDDQLDGADQLHLRWTLEDLRLLPALLHEAPGLVELAKKKDFGQYIDKQRNDLVVGFITTNDITGGNSGSPVLNANGELIGLAFDGNYEALSHKIAFDAQYNRTICVDIRYVLWCIDKLGGASNIIKELKLVTAAPRPTK